MSEETGSLYDWPRFGAIAGLLGVASYIVVVAAPLPDRVAAFVAALFGPLLGIGCYGLSRLLVAQRRTVTAQLAGILGMIAGALVNAMLMVQLAIHMPPGKMGEVPRSLNLVHLGLDLSWDFYIGAATVMFGWNMLRHPRFGRIFGALGLLAGGALLVLNFSTFPIPPGEAGSIDVGPFVALWYTAASVQTLRITTGNSTPAQSATA